MRHGTTISGRPCGSPHSARLRLAARPSGLPLRALAAALAIALMGCAHAGPRAQLGALGGAASGGLLAAAFGGNGEAIVASIILGGLVGGAVGDAMDQADRHYAYSNTQSALEFGPSGSTSDWCNVDSGHCGTTTPTGTYRASGRYCREYEETITIGGRTEWAYGRACRQPDGSWKIVN